MQRLEIERYQKQLNVIEHCNNQTCTYKFTFIDWFRPRRNSSKTSKAIESCTNLKVGLCFKLYLGLLNMALALTALILRGVMATSAQYCSLKSNIFRDNSVPEEEKR